MFSALKVNIHLSLFRKIYSTVTRTIKEMDRALTDMAVVTSMNRQQAWELTGEFQKLATQTGKTTSEIADMATKFYQQGKSTTEVLKLTEAAAKAATIAGIDGSRSIDLLTNAMNGFQISANKAMEVSDKFAALAAGAATDYEELATGLSKVAAQANLAGMSMDFTLGLLTKGIEVTREAPETIGTALKTVISRMRELTDYEKTLEDGVDVNRVAKALSNIGVELMDTNGQFRDLEAVLTEVGQKWDTLNTNQQANVAVAMAGTRQQSRFIAMMQDFDRTLELVDLSASSYGATMAQSADYMEGLAAAQTRLTTAVEGMVTGLMNSDVIIGVVDTLTGLVNFTDQILNNAWALIPILVVIGGHLAHSLATKAKEFEYQKRINQLKTKEQITTKKMRLEEVKRALDTFKNYKNTDKQGEELKEQYITLLKTAQLEEERAGNAALASYYGKLISDAEKELKIDKTENNLLRQEELKLESEKQLLEFEIGNLEKQSTEQMSIQYGLIGKMTTGLTGYIQLFQTVPAILRVVLGLRKKNNAEQDKENGKKAYEAILNDIKNKTSKKLSSA